MNELRHLQLVILEIMKDIDALCKKNGIEYYLLGGSAIGAVRHKGFIPWDDDLDIVMSPYYYNRFISVCQEQLDSEKYCLMVGLEDYPLYFTKIKLRGTHLNEKGASFDSDHDGIYLDVFKMENAPSGRIRQLFQYVKAKYFLCYQLSENGFEGKGFKEWLMLLGAKPLKYRVFREWIKKSIEKYNDDTEYYGSFYFRSRFKNAFTKKSVFGTPHLTMFENLQLPIPEYYDEYLTQMFGDYMTPPPPEKRVGYHLISVDFGKY